MMEEKNLIIAVNARPVRKCRNQQVEKFTFESTKERTKVHKPRKLIDVEKKGINYKIISDLAVEESLHSRSKCKVCGLIIDKLSIRIGIKGFRRFGAKTFPTQLWAHPQCCASFMLPTIDRSLEEVNNDQKKLLKLQCELCKVPFFRRDEETGNILNQDTLYICFKIGYVRRLFCSKCFRGHLTKDGVTILEKIDLGVSYQDIDNFHSLDSTLQEEVCTLLKGN